MITRVIRKYPPKVNATFFCSMPLFATFFCSMPLFACADTCLTGAIDQGLQIQFLHSLSKGRMKTIQLDCTSFPDSVFAQVPVSLPASLEKLQLTFGEDGDTQMGIFCSNINALTLVSLDVSDSNLHEAAAGAIADAICSERLQVTMDFNLSGNLVGLDGVVSIARCICGGSLRRLEVMTLAGIAAPRIIGSRDPPAGIVDSSCLQPFFNAIATAQLPNLTTLDISDNSLGSKRSLF